MIAALGTGAAQRLSSWIAGRLGAFMNVTQPLTIAVAHTKGGVGKTTTTLLLGRFLSERWRVALAD